MFRYAVLLVALPGQIPPSPAPPGPTRPIVPSLHHGETEIVCPIGGETFRTPTVTAYSIAGRRPDGKPFSDVPFPLPMPVCPGNGLLVLPALTPVEIARLGPIVASPTYRLLVRNESSFYRAYWLAVTLHRPAADAVEFLLPAIWEAKDRDRDDPRRSRTARYQRALIEATDRLSGAMSLDDRAYFWFEAANAYREMGQFGAAERTRQRAVVAIPRLSRAPLEAMIVGLGPAIARHDARDEPLDLIPAVQAAIRCRLRPRADAFGRRYCAEHPAVP